MFDLKTSKAKLNTSAGSVKEGDILTTTVFTENVKPGTALFWGIKGIRTEDLAKGELTGTGSVDDKGRFSFSHAFSEDRLTEGTETVTIMLFAEQERRTPIAETRVTILDSSTAPVATPAYKLNPSATSIKEGDTLTTTVFTENVKPGTTLFWAIGGKGINSKDLAKGDLKGSGTVSENGSFSFSQLFSEDLTTEGDETLIISLFADKSLKQPIAETTVALLDGSSPTKVEARFNSTPKTLKEGHELKLSGFSTNLKPGTTLYWNLDPQTSDATLNDFKASDNKPDARSTTIDENGNFQIILQALQDKEREKSERFQIQLFETPTAKQAFAVTKPIKLIDTNPKSESKNEQQNEQTNQPNSEPTEQNTSLKSLVLPARLGGERIPIQKLIDFSLQDDKATFAIENSNNGGHIEYQNETYNGQTINNISKEDLSKIYYIPQAPSGHYETSALKTINIESPTETFSQKEGLQGKKNGNKKLILQESTVQVEQRQDPYDPTTVINPKNSESISDQISLSIYLPDGSSKTETANWTTRANWKPEITLMQESFTADNRDELSVSFSEIVEIYDLDGDEITNIKIEDISAGAQTGYFKLNDKIYQGKALPLLQESELGDVQYFPGEGGKNNITVTASDALNGTSKKLKFELKTEKPAKTEISKLKQTFDTADIGTAIPLSNLINLRSSDAIDSNIYNLELKKKGKSEESIGHFTLNGKSLKSNQLVNLKREQLNKINFIPTNSKIKSTFTVKATDSFGRTTTKSSPWKTTANKKPTVNVEPMQLPPNRANQPIKVSNLISADDDGNSIANYSLKSSKGQGSFKYNGKTYSNQLLTVGADQLSRVTYIPPTSGGSDRVRITASDGENESTPSFVNWSTGGSMKLGSLTRSFDLSVDKEWNIGSFLGTQNERTYSKFFGLDKTISNVNFNRDIGVAGVKFKTGRTTMKAGLQLDAGYGLGSLRLQGGLSASATLDENGITFEGTSSNPTLDFELPYAYLGLDAVGKFKFQPSLKFWYDVFLADGETSNLLGFLNKDIDITRPLIDLDTRYITGNNYTRSFNFGALSANASVPRFGRVSELSRIPPAIQTASGWTDGFGDGIAYGIDGSTTLVNLNLSLGQVASYFGLPLSINKSIWGGGLRVNGTLADASIGIDAEMNYGARVAVKPNVYATVEGLRPNKRYDILGDDTSIDPSDFRDSDNDGKITVTIEADPIIAANASVSIAGGVDAGAEVLSASARLSKWGYNKTWNVGPLWEGGPWNLYSNEFTLIDISKSYALSDLAPNLQNQLSVEIDLPIA